MRCVHIPKLHAIVSGPDLVDQEVTVNGRVVRFDFDERFGPLVLGRRGKPLANQPGDRDPFWPAFEAWHDRLLGLLPQCATCRGEGMVAGVRLSRRMVIATPCSDCNGKGRASRGTGGTG